MGTNVSTLPLPDSPSEHAYPYSVFLVITVVMPIIATSQETHESPPIN